MENVLTILEERGFIEALSSPALIDLANKPLKVYCGFDPTSDSLHLGNYVAMMGLAWFQKYSHEPVVVLGGATGMIGDPSGKNAERQLLDEAVLENNLKGIKQNFVSLFENLHLQQPVFVNNLDWYKNQNFIQFLREVGKLFRMGPMLGKESVKKRIQSEEGMSFTEFSYQVLQGYDFLHLFDALEVTLQLGGSDQWGNITAGTDLIRKVRGASAYGLTFPLLTKSDGTKFGKTESGAIWLSPDKLSPYEFYQHLVRTEDADVIKMMRLLTFMDMSEIKEYERQMQTPNYVPRTAQKRLAEEITRAVHGDQSLKIALEVTQSLSPGSETQLDVATLEAMSNNMPNFELTQSEIVDRKLSHLLVHLNLQPSNGSAKKLIQNGGVYVNNRKITDENYSFCAEDLIEKRLILLSTGKKNKFLIRLIDKNS